MSFATFDPLSALDRIVGRSGFGESGTGRALALPVDVYQEDDKFIVCEMDVPGIDPDQLELQVERNMLSVTGDRPARHGAKVVVCERPHAKFMRQIVLGADLDTDSVSADYANGVLTVTIPMSSKARARRIDIGGGDSRTIETTSTEATESPEN